MSGTAVKKPLEQAKVGADQALAADPLRSAWVGASAGTGKTKVLVDRALRLMLPRPGYPAESATAPGKILCLTFTKTAAAEMSERIYDRLSRWSIKGDAELREELTALIGAAPTPEMEQEARRLFARVLDTPGGLKFMTIHSFCQSVLKRFPIEAGVPSHFQMMDEQSALEYLSACQHKIIAEARANPASRLAEAFSRLTLLLDAAAMAELMQQIMARRSLLGDILRHHGDAEGQADKTVAAVYRHLNVKQGLTEEDVIARAVQLAPAAEADLRRALAALLNSGKKDQDKALCMQPWLEQPSRRIALFEAYCRAFFKADGEVYAAAANKEAIKACPNILAIMQREAERLAAFRAEVKAVRLARLNEALLVFAAAMVGHYTQHKRDRDKLDFDDLIIKTGALLSDERMAPWVRYKLDEGIDHILVDEAQDTSRNQWRVVEGLSGEFFDGCGAREDVFRTLFVVGDEKQSIFSFQGADPYEFSRMQRLFGLRVLRVQEGWDIVLKHSFRSTRAVLEVVDGVFSSLAVRKGVSERAVEHTPFRALQAGTVELWPLFKTSKKKELEPWQMPTEINAGDNAASRLAERIADMVKGWIDDKEFLPSRGRAVRAGDILVLVRSRGPFVELLIRALKARGVNVAGIDRIKLTEEIAVMDLLALAQFALLPKDDLTLATLLKSPLVGYTEDQLFDLCHDRAGTLWAAVQEKNPALARWLRDWAGKAGKATPYAFFAEALNAPCHADPVSGRRAFYSRLGFDIQDALDEFLNRCLHYEQSHTPSLQTFVDWFVRGEAEIKREQESGKMDQVRIMTVHASKGLQAPIVFLPDTTKTPEASPKARIQLVWPEDEKGVPLWAPRKEFHVPAFTARHTVARERQDEEYRRLLYVALTRAEDRLYICGHHGKNNPPANCWYNLVAEAFPASAEKIDFIIEGEEEPQEARRYVHAQGDAPDRAQPQEEKADIRREPLPAWVGQPLPEEPAPAQPLAPSRPDDEEPAVKGPLSEDVAWKFRRGVIVHQILEVLPQLPPDKWERALAHYLTRPALGLPPAEQENFAAEILAVLRHPEFAPIFGPGSRAEVPVTGQFESRGVGAKILSGQMDRLLVTEKEVLVIDYKTNRPPPQAVEDVPPVYLKQMAAYREVLRNIYKNHDIKCALLWTDGPRLMPLPGNKLDPYAP